MISLCGISRQLWTRQQTRAFDNRFDRGFPLNGHDVDAGHAFDFPDLLNLLDTYLHAFCTPGIAKGDLVIRVMAIEWEAAIEPIVGAAGLRTSPT